MNPASIAGGGRHRFDRSLRLIALMTGVIVVVTALTRLPVWNLLELRTFDYLSTLDDPAPPENGPIVVAIDEPSFAEINRQWPWPRDIHARLVTALRAAGARAIGQAVVARRSRRRRMVDFDGDVLPRLERWQLAAVLRLQVE